MYGWVIKIAAAAVALTIAGYILPKGNIKKAAMLAFSFLFLTVLLLPLKNFTMDVIQQRTALRIEKNTLLSQTDGNTAEKQVMDQYKQRICEEITSALGKISLECTELSVTVDEKIDSAQFGYIQSVSCEIFQAQIENKDSIDKVKIPEIVIDLNGVRIGESKAEKEEQEKLQNEYQKKASAAISELTGADESRIYVKWRNDK